jgi:hypothetical protein
VAILWSQFWRGVQVERVQFDPDTCVLRVSGKNQAESEFVKVRLTSTSI